jgi:hypothetical protein
MTAGNILEGSLYRLRAEAVRGVYLHIGVFYAPVVYFQQSLRRKLRAQIGPCQKLLPAFAPGLYGKQTHLIEQYPINIEEYRIPCGGVIQAQLQQRIRPEAGAALPTPILADVLLRILDIIFSWSPSPETPSAASLMAPSGISVIPISRSLSTTSR